MRDNLTNYYLNKLNLDNVNKLVIEDLSNVKYKSKLHRKVNNRLQHWIYPRCINYFESICMEKGIMLVKVSPAYTSQTCSSCGNIDKSSRDGINYKCLSCGYEIDADVNASINILQRGSLQSP